MPTYVDINPTIIRWAIDRSGLSQDDHGHEIIERADQWIKKEKKPTLRMLEQFAKKVMVPLGYLFLDSPPDEQLPVADYRTFDDKKPRRPSPNLIDTINEMQLRQDWMREYLIEIEAAELSFVDSLDSNISVLEAARIIKHDLKLDNNWSRNCNDVDASIRVLRNAADKAGILVFLNSVVGMNNHRPLDPNEFRGFVLVDNLAPLVFVNHNDTSAAQVFTLVHELIHIWIGQGGVFNLPYLKSRDDQQVEKKCNQIAAELLVPQDELLVEWKNIKNNTEPFKELAKTFNVSTIVVARRALDNRLITKDTFFDFYNQEVALWSYNKAKRKEEGKTGGTFHNNQGFRFPNRFKKAVVSAVRSGFLNYYHAYRLTGMKGKTFDDFTAKIKEGQ